MTAAILWFLGAGLICLPGAIFAQGNDIEVEADICFHPPETGVCRAAIPAWFFNTSSAVCEEFIYGGCPSASQNRFSNREECIKKCAVDVCLLRPDPGPCRAAFKKWHYNKETRLCEEFAYGGCEGNENMFSTKSQCEIACAGANLPCELGDTFDVIGKQSVISGSREEEKFMYSCERRCRQKCLRDHKWGYCLAFSTRKRWYGGCNCYLFDRYLSDLEFASHKTKGLTKNRLCKEGSEINL